MFTKYKKDILLKSTATKNNTCDMNREGWTECLTEIKYYVQKNYLPLPTVTNSVQYIRSASECYSHRQVKEHIFACSSSTQLAGYIYI